MSRPAAFQWSIAARVSSASTWPIISAIVRKPSSAISSRTSSAMNSKNVSTNSGLPLNRLRSSGFWVAMPTGHVSRWQTRIITQPDTTSGRRGEAELLGTEQGGDDDVAAGLQLAVGLHDDAVAQAVEQQRLLGLGEAELPRSAGVLERRQRAGAGATVVAGDQHDVCFRLADSGRNGADTHFGDELDVHARRRVGVLEVVDELLEVLDRVDVVVRRRADQPDARRRVPRLGDPRVHLVAGQLAALAGLGALGHLDLQVVGVRQVLRRHPEAPRRHLLDRRAACRGRAAGRRPRRPRPCSTWRRCGSSRWPASRGPPSRSIRSSWPRWRSAARSTPTDSTSSRGIGSGRRPATRTAPAAWPAAATGRRRAASTGGRCRSAWPAWRAAA